MNGVKSDFSGHVIRRILKVFCRGIYGGEKKRRSSATTTAAVLGFLGVALKTLRS